MLADILTAYLLDRQKRPRKLQSNYAINKISFLNKYSHQNDTISSAAGAAREQPQHTGAQHVALTPEHCGRRAGTSPLSRKLDIFWKHWCDFTCTAIALHFCSNNRAFQKVLKQLVYLFPYRQAGSEVQGCCRGLCSAQHGCSRSAISFERQTGQAHRYPGSSELFFKIHSDKMAEKEDAPEGLA